jgi:hypothetical protein
MCVNGVSVVLAPNRHALVRSCCPSARDFIPETSQAVAWSYIADITSDYMNQLLDVPSSGALVAKWVSSTAEFVAPIVSAYLLEGRCEPPLVPRSAALAWRCSRLLRLFSSHVTARVSVAVAVVVHVADAEQPPLQRSVADRRRERVGVRARRVPTELAVGAAGSGGVSHRRFPRCCSSTPACSRAVVPVLHVDSLTDVCAL